MVALFRNASIAMAALGLFAGCASIPDVTARYYFPKAQTQLQLTESLMCNKNSSRLLTVATVASPTVYSSDLSAGVGSLSYKGVSGPFTDTDLTLNFTDDGRLSGINETSTGQGDTIVKDILMLATTISLAPEAAAPLGAASLEGICDAIRSYAGGDGKAITLLYSARLDYQAKDPAKPDDLSDELPFSSDPTNTLYPTVAAYRNLRPYTAKVSTDKPAQSAATFGKQDCSIDDPKVELNRYIVANVNVFRPDAGTSKGEPLWTSAIPVPLKTGHFCLPIPPAQIFGGQTFGIQLSTYGSIQKLEYGKKTGVHDATDAATALATALKGPTTTAQAANLKAQTDLIAQQQRLVQCQADPATCKP